MLKIKFIPFPCHGLNQISPFLKSSEPNLSFSQSVIVLMPNVLNYFSNVC